MGFYISATIVQNQGRSILIMKTITNNVLQFANKRGLSQKTLTDLRIESGQGQYGKDKLESIVFGYYDTKGERVNYKARAIEERYLSSKQEERNNSLI